MESPVKQYLINNPIDNPDENEPLAPLMPSSQILNTTVDKSKCSNKKNGVVRAYAANTNKGII